MPYTPTNWVEGVTTLGPTNMNKIETALAAAPGSELAYVEFTADVSVVATTAAGATTIVTAAAVTFDGSTAVWVEFQAARVETSSVTAIPSIIDLWDGASDLGILGSVLNATNAIATPFSRARRLTPSSGSHTFSVRGWQPSGGPYVIRAGAGGAGVNLPGHIRITRV